MVVAATRPPGRTDVMEREAFELPEPAEGWALTKIGDVANIVGGGTPSTKNPGHFCESGGHAWLTPADLSGFKDIYISRGARNLTPKGLEASSARLMPKGTVLMSSRAPIGYVAVATRQIATNQGFKSFVCRDGLEPEYVFFWLKFIRPILENMGSGSTFAEISGAKAREIPLMVAPLPEQRRIVAKVASLLTQVTAARDRLAKVPLILKRFRQAVLAAACSGQLTKDWREGASTVEPAAVLLERISTERARRRLPSARQVITDEGIDLPDAELPETWTWCRVGDVAHVCLGGTPSRRVSGYWGGHIPWVSSGEVANCRIAGTAEQITRAGLENSNAKVYPSGTVLIAMIGEGKTRGQAALLDIDACTNQNVAGLVFDVGNVNSEYVWYWALAEYEKNRDIGRGGNQPALNGRKVRAFPLPLPPLAEQVEIVRRVKTLVDLADLIGGRVARATSRAETVSQAVLARAFSGALVPTEAELARVEGREYEPASVLLERIRAGVAVSLPRLRRRPKNGSPRGRRIERRAV
jgi:type I restriction enzyme S subunit